MQLNITTDYAIRVLLCLGSTEELMTGSYIAEKMKIPSKYFLKIAMRLKKAGMVGATAGAKGGYYLTKGLNEITLLEVLKVMEPSTRINRCLEDDGYCNRGASDTCQIRRYYRHIQEEVEQKWLSKSLSDILRHPWPDG